MLTIIISRFYLPTVPSTLCGTGSSSTSVQYNSNYCHPIYEVPRYPVVNGVNGINGTLGGPNGHLTLANGHTLMANGQLQQLPPGHHHQLGQGGHNTVYEGQGTLDSQHHLTAKIY